MGLSGLAAQEVKGTGAWVVSEVWGPWKRFRVRSSEQERGEDPGGSEGGAQPFSHVLLCVPRQPRAGQFAVPGGGHSCQAGNQAALGGLSLGEEARQRTRSCSPFLSSRQAGRVTLIGGRLGVEHIANGTTRLCHFSLPQPARVGKEPESAKDRDTGVYGGTPTQNSILQAYFSFGFLNHLLGWKVNEARLPRICLLHPGPAYVFPRKVGKGTSGLLFISSSFFPFFSIFRDRTETLSGQIM